MNMVLFEALVIAVFAALVARRLIRDEQDERNNGFDLLYIAFFLPLLVLETVWKTLVRLVRGSVRLLRRFRSDSSEDQS